MINSLIFELRRNKWEHIDDLWTGELSQIKSSNWIQDILFLKKFLSEWHLNINLKNNLYETCTNKIGMPAMQMHYGISEKATRQVGLRISRPYVSLLLSQVTEMYMGSFITQNTFFVRCIQERYPHSSIHIDWLLSCLPFTIFTTDLPFV